MANTAYQPPPIDYNALNQGGTLPKLDWFNPLKINWAYLFFQWIIPAIILLWIASYLKERYDQMQRIKRYVSPYQLPYVRW